jgi:hypothetical protein
MRRFYRIDIQPDVFGLWLLVKEWDGSAAPVNRRCGHSRISEAQRAFDRQRRIKEKRGYADTKLNGTSK